MKKLIQFITLSTLAFTLTGCDPFEGLLQVKKAFTVTETSGSKIQIPAGDQNAKLDFLSRDRVRITLQIDNKSQKVTMNLPKNMSFPENGQFVMTAAQLQQSFSIQGTTQTRRTDSQMYRGYEQCNYTRYEVVCRIENNQQVCRQEPRTVYGQQRVEYFTRFTDQNIAVKFVEASDLAIFNGAKSSSERIYTFKDYCF